MTETTTVTHNDPSQHSEDLIAAIDLGSNSFHMAVSYTHLTLPTILLV